MAAPKRFDELALIVDIETVALADGAIYLEPAVAPANDRDLAKTASYIQETTADTIATAALDPDLNRIVALGYRLEDRDLVPTVLTCPDEAAERIALLEFWRLVACEGNRTRKLIGFNAFGFDLPTLMRRSLYLEIWPARFLSVDRYRSDHIDLYQKLSYNGAIKAHSLRFYAQRFGFPIEMPELSGADIVARVEGGDWKAVAAHCAADVNLIAYLAERLGYLGGVDGEEAQQWKPFGSIKSMARK